MNAKSTTLAGLLCLVGSSTAWGMSSQEVDLVRTDPATLPASGDPDVIAPGIAHPVDLRSGGVWSDATGWSTWTYTAQVPGARSVAFQASAALPEGAAISVSGADGTVVQVYKARDLAATGGRISSVLVPGDLLRLALRLPTGERAAAQLSISHLFAGIRPSPLEAAKRSLLQPDVSGATQVNWSCVASSANTLAADATVMYTVEASNPEGNGPALSQCTGTLVNDVPQDRRLFMLTAAHCGQTNWDAGSVTVYWNRVSSCAAGLVSAFDVAGPTTSGATTRALFATGGINHEDQWLMELSGSLPNGSEAAFAGWDSSDVTQGSSSGPSGVFGIDHSSSETKQYTASGAPPSQVSGTQITYDWDTGETLPGASGSSIFESDQQTFGTLSGGGTDLDGNPISVYQELFASWHGDGGTDDPASSTGYWLDPNGTGTTSLPGIPAIAAPGVTIGASPDSVTTGQAFTLTWSSQDASSCTAGGAWSGSEPLSGSTTISETSAGDYTYTLACSNTGGTTAESATVVVRQASGSSSSGGSSNNSSGGGGAFDWSVLLCLLLLLAVRVSKALCLSGAAGDRP